MDRLKSWIIIVKGKFYCRFYHNVAQRNHLKLWTSHFHLTIIYIFISSSYIYWYVSLRIKRTHRFSVNLSFRLSARQTKLYSNKVLSDQRLGAKLRVTENRCVLFNSLTYVYLALLPQHWALYAKVDSTPTFIYIYIYIYKTHSFDPKIADAKQGGGQFYFNLIKLHWK